MLGICDTLLGGSACEVQASALEMELPKIKIGCVAPVLSPGPPSCGSGG